MNPSAHAGQKGLNPGQGRFHMPQGHEAHVPQPWSLHSRGHAPQQEKPPQWEGHALQLKSRCNERKPAQQWRPSAAKKKEKAKTESSWFQRYPVTQFWPIRIMGKSMRGPVGKSSLPGMGWGERERGWEREILIHGGMLSFKCVVLGAVAAIL